MTRMKLNKEGRRILIRVEGVPTRAQIHPGPHGAWHVEISTRYFSENQALKATIAALRILEAQLDAELEEPSGL